MPEKITGTLGERLSRANTVRQVRIETIGGTVQESGRIVVEGSQTTAEENISTTIEQSHDYLLDCGHVAKGRENVAGACECGAFCCPACLAFCAEDRKPLCPRHQYNYRGAILCEDCYHIIRAREAVPWL